MSALGHTFRYQVYNGSASSITVTITERRWKFDSSGAVVWSTEQTPISAVSVSTLSYSNSGTIDNSSNAYLGSELAVLMDVSGATTGSVIVWLQNSTDGGTDWPSNGGGIPVGSYYFNASSTDATVNYRV